MKKTILILVILLSCFSSCSIDEDNRSYADPDVEYLTNPGFEALINANYSQLREIYGNDPWLFCAGTDLYAAGRTSEPEGLSRYTQLNPASEGVDYLYNKCYAAIQKANMALYYSTITAPASTLNNRIGEVKYLRANAYFLLVQTYGGVSLVQNYSKTPQMYFERNTAAEIYDFIITDLLDSQNLVSTAAYNGRVNKRAVQELLAKVYLTRGYESFASSTDFANAATYADLAINNQALSITPANLWKPGNDMNAEVIFSVQYATGSVSASPQTLGNKQGSYFGPYQGGADVAGKAPFRTYNLCPTQFAISLYTQADLRWKSTFMDICYTKYYDFYLPVNPSNVFHYYAPQWITPAQKAAFLAANPTLLPANYHDYGTYGARVVSLDYATIPVRKFDDPTAPYGAKTSTRDIVLSRLGETYLIAAEAYLKKGDLATGLTRLNAVRARAGVPNATAAEFNIDYILDESARETLGEYHRWFDLKRTGKLVERASLYNYLIQPSNFNGNNGQLKILRPIPQSALDLNLNKNFPQNPAY